MVDIYCESYARKPEAVTLHIDDTVERGILPPVALST